MICDIQLLQTYIDFHLILERSITWTITWKKTKAGIYIGVAAAVVGVAIIVIIVVVCWQKHKG